MSIRDIADAIAELARSGQFDAIGETYWADDVVSIESGEGPMAHLEGREAVAAKSAWWAGAHEVHGSETHGPWINGDQFALRFLMDVTVKESGERMTMDEIALYTIDDGEIVEERFYY